MNSKYIQLEPIGMGAFGLVCSGISQNGKTWAIKKISKPFVSNITAKRTFREVKLLVSFHHENVFKVFL